MARHILKCTGCGAYTMSETCSCGSKAVTPRPPKYSPEDAYGRYRRKVKEPELKQRGFL
ncbi:RNA-protein complex protein Nop10 [Candidatus Woesearchaeota archaeon]|nr:RNA-protein complex protein Nop10 [Candidatus Woesearchaeota archaeon]